MRLIALLFTSFALAPTALAQVQGNIRIDGSSTVFPLTEAVAEEFQKANPKTRVAVGVSGTGGGLKKFGAGEIDVAGASRPVKAEEAKKASDNGIGFIELPIAYDGIAVVVNPKNDWAKSLTMAQLKKMWEPGSTVKTWKDLDPAFPAKPIKMYGPGADSGTFDYFTEHVMGKARASRTDYTSSEDDNVIVNGVGGDEGAIGYFGYAYYAENKSKLRAVPLDGGKGTIAPSEDTIKDSSYPLSRPVFLVISTKAAQRPEVDAFVKYYLHNAAEMAKAVGFTALPKKMYEDVTKRYETRKTGNWSASH